MVGAARRRGGGDELPHTLLYLWIGVEEGPLCGARPWEWTVSGCCFDRLAGVLILEGVAGAEATALLSSTVHGTGRLFGRKEARRRFGRAEMEAWLNERAVTLRGGDLDESPMAYRRLPEVLARHAGSIRILHTLRPFAVVMAGKDVVDPFRD